MRGLNVKQFPVQGGRGLPYSIRWSYTARIVRNLEVEVLSS